jgi:hypothetical protein
MRTGLFYLQAAKRHELADLHYLAATSALTRAIGNTIHQVQRERGLSNLLLASAGQRAGDALAQQIGRTNQTLAALQQAFDQLDLVRQRPGSATRLYSMIAYALQGLQALPALRTHVAALDWSTQRSTRAYSRLVSALLSVVFEAADTATDPDISRLLVGMFHFMQAKELAGQERAFGTAMFASATAGQPEQQQLQQLIDSQQRCLQTFADFASDAALKLWQSTQVHAVSRRLAQLRGVLLTSTSHGALNSDTSPTWFEVCSERIDQMKTVEDALADHLQSLCQHKAAQAEQELQRLLGVTEAAATGDFFDDAVVQPEPQPGHALETRLGRSVLQLVHAQAQRLAAVNDELDQVRATLTERKSIERAKGLLMAQHGWSENQAHAALRQSAMNQGRRLVDVALALCNAAV